MKYSLAAAAAAVVLAALTACGPTATPAANTSATATTKPSPTASPTPTTAMIPDVSGMAASQASIKLTDLGFRTTYVDKDGKPWGAAYPNKDVVILGTNPAANSYSNAHVIKLITSVTEEEQKAGVTRSAEQAKLAARYKYTCGIGSTVPSKDFASYKDVWTSTYYHASRGCLLYLDGETAYDTKTLLPSEQAIVDIVAANGGDASVPGYAYAAVYDLCAIDKPGYADELPAKPKAKQAEAKAALAMCPDVPHAAALQEAATAIKVSDGNKVVGKDMEAGTWKTNPNTKDCYWSRNTGGGDIIANNFVGFAPDGVTVTVYPGEGFESSRCGIWTKIG